MTAIEPDAGTHAIELNQEAAVPPYAIRYARGLAT